MRPRIKWGGAVVTVLLLILCVGSWWKALWVHTPFCDFALHANCFEIWLFDKRNAGSQHFELVLTDLQVPNSWWFHVMHADYSLGGGSTTVYFPIWFLALFTAIP